MQLPWQPTINDSRPFLITSAVLFIIAWAVLFSWGASPYAHYLDHHALASVGSASQLWVVGVFAGGWTLMIIAMMLPTSLPLISVFRSVTSARADRGMLVGLLIVGYLLIWLLFGVAIHAVYMGVHEIAGAAALLTNHPWALGAGVFGIAGAYQFSALKYRCLDKCRSPLSFVVSYWSGRNERWNALALGIHHGAFCVGCCWSLMLLMFVVGHANVGWMLLLGVVMGAEKNLRKGRALAKPLGIGLLIGAVLIAGVGVAH